jgi:hypothetical protein
MTTRSEPGDGRSEPGLSADPGGVPAAGLLGPPPPPRLAGPCGPGGLVGAALRPIEGGEQIARYLADLAGRAPDNVTFLERTVNGRPGLVAQEDGVTVTVFALDVAGDRITHIWAVRNPDKLRPWTAGWQLVSVVLLLHDHVDDQAGGHGQAAQGVDGGGADLDDVGVGVGEQLP